MAKSSMVTVRLKPAVKEQLDALARDTNRSKSDIASEAIEAYVGLNAWQVGHIQAALAEDENGGPSVPHDEVVRWMESWGSDKEMRRPQPKKAKHY